MNRRCLAHTLSYLCTCIVESTEPLLGVLFLASTFLATDVRRNPSLHTCAPGGDGGGGGAEGRSFFFFLVNVYRCVCVRVLGAGGFV